MEPRLHKDEEIEKTLAGIDRISRADAPPFFYTRLQAQLDKKTGAATPFRMTGNIPALSLATLSLLLILNIAAIRSYMHSSKESTAATQRSTNGIQAFAETYNLGGSPVFTDKTTDQ